MAPMSTEEFEQKCKELCPNCAAGVTVRQREDTKEWIHDWAFGGTDPKTGRLTGIGHGICGAHDFRTANGR